MEKDDEVSGEGNSYTTEFRQYDSRIARWKSLDPLSSTFPWQSPYVGFDNNPIVFNDPKGLAVQKGGDDKSDGGGDPPKGSQEWADNNSGAADDKNYGYGKNGPMQEIGPEKNVSKAPNVGNELLGSINGLPMKEGGFPDVPVFKSTGLKPTYENSTKYRNCDGNCYMTSTGKVNNIYEELFNITPINITFDSDGEIRTTDYKLASSQSGTYKNPFYGYGVGGVLASKGLGEVVNNVNTGLKPGAQVQIWYALKI